MAIKLSRRPAINRISRLDIRAAASKVYRRRRWIGPVQCNKKSFPALARAERCTRSLTVVQVRRFGKREVNQEPKVSFSHSFKSKETCTTFKAHSIITQWHFLGCHSGIDFLRVGAIVCCAINHSLLCLKCYVVGCWIFWHVNCNIHLNF